MKMGITPTDAYGVHKGMVGRTKVPHLWGLDVLSMTSTTSVKGFSKPLLRIFWPTFAT